MITLYQRTTELFDIAGNSIGWQTKPVNFPDTFFLYSGLQYNWTDNTVTRNGKTYYLDKLVINQVMDIPSIDEWKSHYGNDIKYEYYTGDASEAEYNPSGNIKNAKRAIYLSSNITKYILEFYYNENDQVVKISSLAPQDSISSGNEQQQEEIIGDDTEQDLTKLKFAVGKELILTDNNTPVIRGNGRCIMVTRRKTKNPLLSDGIQPEENTGKIKISLTSPQYNLQCFAYNEQNTILFASEVIPAVSGTPTTIDILNNYQTPIAYVAINLYYNDAESNIDEATVNQEDLGLTVTFVESLNLVIRREGSADVVMHLLKGDTVAYSSLPNASKANYDFDGWYIGELHITDNFVITDNIVIEARYTRLFTLTKINDGAQSTQSYRDGTSVTLEAAQKAGHTFIGWSVDGVTIHPSTFTITENITLTALYTVNQYTLTLVVDGQSTPSTYDYGTAVNLTTPSKANYTFDGWFADGASEPTTSPITITENLTLTARFTMIQYTVTLVNVDGRGLNTQDTIVCDSGHSLLESEVKAKLDESLNTFEACYTDSEFTNAVTFPFAISNNITLYCKFQEIGG